MSERTWAQALQEHINFAANQRDEHLLRNPVVSAAWAQAAFLGAIALQLNIANEHAKLPRKSDRWKCPNCGAILTSSLAIERPRCTCGAWMDAA